jgi:AcrR family transcriptional regulator
MQLATLATPDQRGADILGRVRSAFAEKGFDGASMQDLARSAGMSVGNFYRYFPSKAAIIEAMINLDLNEMEQDFATVLSSPKPIARLREMIRRRIGEHQICHDGQLWAEITAVAQRKPEIAAITCRMETAIIANLSAVFAIETGLSPAEALSRFQAHAAFIVLLVKSSATVSPDRAALHDDLTALIIRTIDQTLDQISGAPVKG